MENYKAIVTTKFAENINTDDIIRADILQESWEKKFFAKYAFDKYDPDFRDRCKNQKNAVVAGKNFACGSSREHAVYAIQYNDVEFVVAEIDPKTGVAFPDIFYRNSLNNGLKLIPLKDVSKISLGDELELDLENQILKNNTKNETYEFKIPEEDMKLMKKGGMVGVVKSDLESRL
jgi:3-isopropylmalate/(R)-2-methylmalate dehydratase small subunit